MHVGQRLPLRHVGGVSVVIKLKALTKYLIACRLVPYEQLDSWTDQVTVDLIW